MDELYELLGIGGDGDGELLALLVYADLNRTLQDTIPVPAVNFDLQNMHPAKARHRFRFSPAEIQHLHTLLRLPDVLFSEQRCPVSSLEGLCILLSRMAYPSRWIDQMDHFGRHPTVLCSIFLQVVDLIHDKAKTRMNFDRRMIERYKREMARAIHARTGCYTNCIGFIDGTVRPTCRPAIFQRALYNGHKHVHALKFQMVVMPNGLIISAANSKGNHPSNR